MGIPRAGLAGAMLLVLSAAALGCQPDSSRASKTFFTRRDFLVGAAGLGLTLGLAPFDQRIAHWAQSSGVQGGAGRRGFFNAVTHVNEMPLTLGAAATYAVSRTAGWTTVADASLHTTQALVLTVASAELIRAPLGRARPRERPDDPFAFSFGAGFRKFQYRSYPSMHSAAAFATAAAVTGEVRERSPRATRIVAPILYAAALVPGITRMYLNQHWASDIAAGAVLGGWLGDKVVRYAHGHDRSRLDRMLLGLTVVPDGRGGMVAAVSRPW